MGVPPNHGYDVEEEGDLQGGDENSPQAFGPADDHYIKITLKPDSPDGEELTKLKPDSPDGSASCSAEKWYNVSSAIMKAGSPYFLEHFTKNSEKQPKRVVLALVMTKSDLRAFRKLLQFMHGGSRLESATALEVAEAMHTAAWGRVQPWIRSCRAELIKRFVTLTKYELTALPLYMITEILRSDDLAVVSEDQVYFRAVLWISENLACHSNIMDQQFAPLIRFHYMTIEVLQVAVVDSLKFRWTAVARAVTTACKLLSNVAEFDDGHFVERVYGYKPIQRFEQGLKLITFLRFTRDECERMHGALPSSVRSMNFVFDDGRFFIRAAADGETNGPRWFGLSIEVVAAPAHDYFLCTVATRHRQEYTVVLAREFTARPRTEGRPDYLLRVPWDEFMEEGGRFFGSNGGGVKLCLQVGMEVVEVPHFQISDGELYRL